jgi:hypothetical protein
MQAAITACSGGASIRSVATDHDIPFSTLRCRVNRGSQPKGQYEAECMQKLSKYQEDHLASWITIQERLGLPVSHAQMRDMANRVLTASGQSNTVGRHWLTKFLRRHPDLKTKRNRSMDSSRLNGASTEVIQQWFSQRMNIPEIKAILPQHRHNMDEIGIMEGLGINGLCLGSADTKVALSKTPDSRVWITILECISAAGHALQPLLIFKGADVQQQWFFGKDHPLIDKIKEWRFTTSTNGWTSYAIALEWLTKIFIPDTATTVPRLLTMDGHGSHVTDDFMWHCYQANIYLLFLPPHSSHVLQPLDLAVFSPLKAAYRAGLSNLSQYTDAAPIGKRLFIQTYCEAREVAINARNIHAGWHASGLWPVNVAKPLMSRLLLKPPPTATTTPANGPINGPVNGPVNGLVNGPVNGPLLKTPRQSQEVRKLVWKSRKLHYIARTDPVIKTLFEKVGKSLDRSTVDQAVSRYKIRALEAEVERLRPRKKKKVANGDPNDRFINIEAIMQVKEKMASQLKATGTVEYDFEDMCQEWSIFDPLVDVELTEE